MIKPSGLFVTLLFTAPSLLAQNGYLSGYIVLNEGDTLFGKLKDRDVDRGRLLNTIRFKQKGKRVKKYSAYDLLSYRVDRVIFESKWYEEKAEFFNFQYLNRYGVGEKVFLRVNSKGKLSCYTKELIDDDSDFDGFELFQKEGDDFFIRANQGLFGLKKKKLANYFTDCPQLVQKIDSGEIKNTWEVTSFFNMKCSE
ncbi:MAG: hypothetical protein AAF519_13990 [Bacteroidota bacterium]